MIIGIGTDIIEIERIRGSISKFGDHFVDKIYTENEKKYCESRADKHQHYAVRFAAKEAVYKALASVKQQQTIGWHSIEIFNNISGAPFVILSPKLIENICKDINIKISLSHSLSYAVAFAIAEKE